MALIDITVEAGAQSVLDRLESLLSLVTKKGRITRKLSDFVVVESKKRAPVDKGKLEENIRREHRNGVETVVSSSESDNGFNYAAYLHETRGWKLGPKSLAKQSGQKERIGPKWLVRAVSENTQELNDISVEEAKDIISANKAG